jgi:hypothetical protein
MPAGTVRRLLQRKPNARNTLGDLWADRRQRVHSLALIALPLKVTVCRWVLG